VFFCDGEVFGPVDFRRKFDTADKGAEVRRRHWVERQRAAEDSASHARLPLGVRPLNFLQLLPLSFS
jgi:hypothetical protein